MHGLWPAKVRAHPGRDQQWVSSTLMTDAEYQQRLQIARALDTLIALCELTANKEPIPKFQPRPRLGNLHTFSVDWLKRAS